MNHARFLYLILAVAAVVFVTVAEAAHAGTELCPALPVHCWRAQLHVMGFVSLTDSGGLTFTKLYEEKTTEADHPGYWMEEFKIRILREVFHSLSRSFRFGEKITVDRVDYLRVLPAKGTDGPPPDKIGCQSPQSYADYNE